MSEKCAGFGKILEDECDLMELQHIEQVLNSYLGFCRRRKTYRFRRQIIDDMGSGFWRYFNVRGHYESVRLKKEYRLN